MQLFSLLVFIVIYFIFTFFFSSYVIQHLNLVTSSTSLNYLYFLSFFLLFIYFLHLHFVQTFSLPLSFHLSIAFYLNITIHLPTSSISLNYLYFSLIFILKKLKIKNFCLNSINKIVLIEWSNTRDTLILNPNTSKKKYNAKQMAIGKHYKLIIIIIIIL